MKTSNQADQEMHSVTRLWRRPAMLLLMSSLVSACTSTPAAPSRVGPELATRSSGLTSTPTGGAAAGVQADAPGEDLESRNKIGIFLGETRKSSDDGASIGLEYERRLSDLLGVGLLWESTPSLRERVVAAPALFLHPIGDLGVLLAPGIEYEDSERVFMFRVGVGWDFGLGNGFTIAPEINYDFVSGSENAVIYGFTVGYEF